MRSWSVTVGVVIASLAITFVLNKIFNVQAFFLVVPFLFPLAWGVGRKSGQDDERE